MRRRAMVPWFAACLGFMGLLLPLGKVVAQCGGYCQSSGSCPATGYGCGTGVCCYCCDGCDSNICGRSANPVYWLASNPPIPYYDWYDTHHLYSNCYQGSNCTYYRTADDAECDGNCLDHTGP
jgi:hypothetical protein